MPARRSKASRRRRKDHSLRLTIITLGTFFLLIGLIVALQMKPSMRGFCANSISCINDLSGKKEAENKGVFMGRSVIAPDLPDTPQFAIAKMKAVLGDTTGDYKHIYVDLSKQVLYAFEGDRIVYTLPVSTGKYNPTPTGDFRIWIWLRYTRMSGGNQALGTYYDLPNVPYTMYYWNSVTPKYWGYSIHGAYWHNNFGHPMSHGCTNMKPEDAEKIFYWTNPTVKWVSYATDANPGTLITVFGTTPQE